MQGTERSYAEAWRSLFTVPRDRVLIGNTAALPVYTDLKKHNLLGKHKFI